MPAYYAKTLYPDRGDGESVFSLDFSYSNQDDVIVTVNGIETLDYVWTTASTITLNTPTTSGDDVAIFRRTNLANRSVDFENAAELTEADLDASAQQVFDAMQEVYDLAVDSIKPNPDGSFSMSGRNLREVADPDVATDAATKGYVDSRITDNAAYATAAANSASAASGSASLAGSSASIALTRAGEASAARTGAENAQDAAESARDTTQSVRNTFVNTEHPAAVAAVNAARDSGIATLNTTRDSCVVNVEGARDTALTAISNAESGALSDIETARLAALNDINTANDSVTQATLDTALADYYTKVAADARYLQASALTPYYTKTEADGRYLQSDDIADFMTAAQLNATYLAKNGTAVDSGQLGGVPAAQYLRTNGTAANSGQLGGVAAGEYLRRDIANVKTADQGFTKGFHSDYAATTGSGTNWGATIYGIGTQYDGSAAGTTYSITDLYGISWLRSTHASANAAIGEGLYVSRAGSVVGGIGHNGIWSSGDVTAFSDAKLKTDLKPIKDALLKVGQIAGFNYKRIDKGFKQDGVIAQDVQKVLPDSVKYIGDKLAVSQGGLIALLVNAVNELHDKVNKLEEAYGD